MKNDAEVRFRVRIEGEADKEAICLIHSKKKLEVRINGKEEGSFFETEEKALEYIYANLH